MARPFIPGPSRRGRTFAEIGVYDSFSNITRRRLSTTMAGNSERTTCTERALISGTRMARTAVATLPEFFEVAPVLRIESLRDGQRITARPRREHVVTT
jgi:hypothetical protein